VIEEPKRSTSLGKFKRTRVIEEHFANVQFEETEGDEWKN